MKQPARPSKAIFLPLLLAIVTIIAVVAQFDTASSAPVATSEVYMPAIAVRTCSFSYCDDFSDPASGWRVTDNIDYQLAYNSNEYQMVIKQPIIAVSSAPYNAVTDFFIETNAHWVTAGGAKTDGLYGVIFGANAALTDYYTFYVWLEHPDLGTAYTLRRIQGSTVTKLIDWTKTTKLLKGTADNQIAVSKQGNDIDLIVNGSIIKNFTQPTFSSPALVGLITVNLVKSDARFDYYLIEDYGLPFTGNYDESGVSADSLTTINAADLFD